ncbi:MMPL family transporter [Marmoricola sp. RAF53]|uniref:MMPL family transporter n=1 Tax=Marmoricola sp. RAF53 TaxID=3233059 RepID=UPI003F9E5699
MSIFLYRLGGTIARHRWTFVAGWLLLLFLAVGGSRLLGDEYDDSVAIPGTESQQGQDVLSDRFGLTGANGQVLFTASTGRITDQQSSSDVAALVKRIGDVKGVAISNPLTASPLVVSADGSATIGQLRFADKVPSEEVLDAVVTAAEPPPGSVVETSVGGDAYKPNSDPSKIPELLGLLVSFMILAITFGAFLPAGMPILNSLVGVFVTLGSVVLVSRVATVSSNAPTLAEMLGLAVGIDYALFLLSRHRRHLGEGLSPTESMSRALATAGSAVVFAGATVVIALAGLSVAKIPVLTVMGLAAAAAVTIAVVVALTLLPAIALLLGERLRPKVRTKPEKDTAEKDTAEKGTARKARKPASERVPFSTRWVRGATKVPVLTIVAVLVVLGIAAVPAASMRLALPDNSTAPEDTTARQTYDEITAEFGEGYNSPLSVAVDVIANTDPKQAVANLSAAIQKVPDVVAITQETPNAGGDTGLVQVVPRAGQTAASTKALVQELRARAPGWEKQYDVSHILVTGQTAINIDVSSKLAGALLPFAAIVIGLSLILLMIVFRSIAVPIKATLGYLLSVGVALGAVVAAFQWGWLDPLLSSSAGPIVSFLPIFVMGVLFGLAMDYEMFLVSAMREEYVRTDDPEQAVYGGFRASSKVVTAAALIMTSVFVAFIPGGSSTIQPIALGLAVGVLVDAFIVRMTLVPAVLILLGRHAWWLAGWLDRLLPEVDVEGAALHRKVEFDTWKETHGDVALLARDLVVGDGDMPLQVEGRPGAVTQVLVPDGVDARSLAHVLAGRARQRSGELVVAGCLLPEQREAVNQLATLIDVGGPPPAGPVEDAVEARARLVSFSPGQRRDYTRRATDLLDELRVRLDGPGQGAGGGFEQAVVDAALALAADVRVVVLLGADDPSAGQRSGLNALARELAGRGVSVAVVEPRRVVPPPRRSSEPAGSHAGVPVDHGSRS